MNRHPPANPLFTVVSAPLHFRNHVKTTCFRPKWGMLHPFEYRTLPITLEPSNPGTNASNVIPTHENLLSIAWHALRAEDTYARDSPLFGGRHRYPFFNALYFRHWKAGSSDGSVFSALRIRRKGWDMYFDQEAFGKRLKELRNIKGMTQEELAEKLNISREHLGRIERGKYGCSIDLLIELSFTLNASTDYLLLGCRPEREQDRRQLLQVISQLSEIARNMWVALLNCWYWTTSSMKSLIISVIIPAKALRIQRQKERRKVIWDSLSSPRITFFTWNWKRLWKSRSILLEQLNTSHLKSISTALAIMQALFFLSECKSMWRTPSHECDASLPKNNPPFLLNFSM